MADFEIGDHVFKWTGDYTGPGVVRGVSRLGNGRVRYLVGHTIIGGTGEFLHVYSSGNLRPFNPVVIAEVCEEDDINGVSVIGLEPVSEGA